MMGRRGWIGGLLAMTFPGLGGQQAPPQNSAPAGQLVPGVQPGVSGQIVAHKVIIIGTGGELLIYSPSAGAGHLIAAGAGSNGTDPYGNTFFQGVSSINGNLVALLESGALFLQAAAGQIAGGFAGEVSAVVGNPGEVFVSSGGASGGDATSQIDLRSQTAGGGTSQATLTAAQVTVNNALSVGTTLATSGDASVNSANLNVGNGSAANINLNPKMATPPNQSNMAAGTATLAQVNAWGNGLYTSLKNRGMIN